MTVDIVQMNRGTGKTRMLVEKTLAEPRAVMIVASTRRARFVVDMMVELLEERNEKRITKIQRHGLEARVFSIHDWHERRPGVVPLDAPVYIDDLDDVLVTLLGNVETCTTSATISQQRPIITEEQS